MPRKVNHYDDDYDEFDDYDYDYDYDYGGDENVEVVKSKTETKRSGIWSCTICTYDNEESMLACDICGVLRTPLPDNIISTSKRTVEGICKDTEASIMAKSLFASLPHQTDKGNNFHDQISTFSHHQINIAPFKFDTPSPDDIVSNGLRTSKMESRVPTNFDELKISETSSATTKEASKNNQSKKGGVKLRGQTNISDVTSDPCGQDRREATKESKHAKSITIDIYSDDEWIESSSTSQPKGSHDNLDDNVDSSVNKGKPKNIAGNLSSITSKATSNKQYKPEKWMLYNETEDTLIQLNLAIVGHVDSGKSTLSGRLLHLSGLISQKQMHKYEKEAKIQGKGSFAYAWALDESAEERERGITMTVAVAYFDSKRYHVVLLDSPGHRDFVPNMISGATQADAAILVIDASVGSFEAGMDSLKGQTKEHAQLIRSFGVEQIVVAVNKMDVIGYSKDRFDMIKQQVGVFLRSCGFKDSCISWLPLSAMENQNLNAAPSDARFLSWYRGPNLLEAIDSFKPPSRDLSKPLLMPICDVVKSASLGQISACGKLEAGALRSGSKVLVMPCGELGTIRSLERDSQACSVARAGDNVSVSLQGVDGSNVMAGGVLCHPDFPVSVAKHLEVKILVLDVATPLLVGSQLEFHIHHVKEAARVVKILSLLDSKTGKVAKKAPRCLTAKQSAVIEILLHGPVCVDEFSNSKALGRVFLRALGRTIAVGIVTRIME